MLHLPTLPHGEDSSITSTPMTNSASNVDPYYIGYNPLPQLKEYHGAGSWTIQIMYYMRESTMNLHYTAPEVEGT